MKASVAMCTFNGARFVDEQLESIAAQSLSPSELVICDDASSDDTFERLQRFAARTQLRVRLYKNHHNLGLVGNFGKAIELTDGDIILLADQDDVWYPHKLKRIVESFQANPAAGLVFSDGDVVDEETKRLGRTLWNSQAVEFGERERQLFAKGKHLVVLSIRNVITGAALAFRSKYKDLVLPFPQIPGGPLHDLWLSCVIGSVSKLAFIEEPLIKYRVHGMQSVGIDATSSFRQWVIESNHKEIDLIRENLIELLADRLAAADWPGSTKAIRSVRHFKFRSSLKHSPLAERACRILAELVRLGYQKYSSGVSGAIGDASPRSLYRLMSRSSTSRSKSERQPNREDISW